MNKEVEITGFDLLNESEKKDAVMIVEEGFKKLKKKLKEASRLKIRIKVYSPEGKKRKFSLDLELFFGSSHFKADSVEWDFAKAVHKGLEKLNTQVEHKFHVSERRKGI